MERELVARAGVRFATIKAGAMHGVGAARALRGAFRTAHGVRLALRILDDFRPDVVLLTGGFVGVPVSLAAKIRGLPSVVYLPDIEPGQAFKVMARLAAKVATTTNASAAFLGARDARKMVVTGYPVREVFQSVSRQTARTHFGLPLDARVLLVFGGSKGAQSINRAVTAGITKLLKEAYVIHVSGANDFSEVSAARNDLPLDLQARYLVFRYLHEDMALAMAGADLTVCRAGASALGELTFVGLPAILVPYPYAWRYQKVNAAYLSERGAAVTLRDEDMADTVRGLVVQATTLLANTAQLSAMRRAALAAGQRDGAQRIAALVMDTTKAFKAGQHG